jgi:hypothetical protein
MTLTYVKWLTAAAASIAVAALAGCNDDAKTVPAAQPPAANVNFSAFVNQAFTNSANSTPVSLDGFTFNFDVDENPTYFNGLISMGTYQ